FHPPFAFLLDRLVALLPIELKNSVVIVSWVSILGVLFLLRQTLRRIGISRSFEAICFLSITAGLPLYIFLSVETGQDSLVLFWSVLTLFLSVLLFWNPPRAR